MEDRVISLADTKKLQEEEIGKYSALYNESSSNLSKLTEEHVSCQNQLQETLKVNK